MSNTDPAPRPRSRGFTRRMFLGTALGAGAVVVGYNLISSGQYRAEVADRSVDILMIGGGIMSATLGVYLNELEPDWTYEVFERLDAVAEESSNGWNNAGTGHSALCELNYTPEDSNGNIQISRAIDINEQFQISRQFWAHQVRRGALTDPRSFINSVPHMSFVFGEDGREYLNKRIEALRVSPLFAGMEISEDPAQIAQWVPLMMEGRDPAEAQMVTATYSELGTDVNLGEISRQFYDFLDTTGRGQVLTGYEVRSITRNDDGSWRVSAFNMLDSNDIQTVDARFVFIGAGGAALPLLQLSGIPEARQFGGFPVGGEFLVTENPALVEQHLAKAYGMASTGSPPMSVPHLDTRMLDGKTVLLFGPFATWSSKFLKHGSYFDLLESMTLQNVVPQLQVGINEFGLVRYLAEQLMLSKEQKIAELRKYFPNVRDEDWHLWEAGQRVQIIKNDPDEGGELKLGTEVVISEDRTMSALLGASPGGSTSPAIMLELLERAFPDRVQSADWQAKLRQMVPSYGEKLNENPQLLAQVWGETTDALQLAMAPPALEGVAPGVAPDEDPSAVPHVSDIQL
ncbi:MAG: malate dehydrogenase (quinone) [Paracoccus sp. (in: a-proteobacteria)]|nr:malate dehydrogenase (quinone) [Paracoccus sp. (in: a-proteobacteria)]